MAEHPIIQHRGHLLIPLVMHIHQGDGAEVLALPPNTLVHVFTSDGWQNDVCLRDVEDTKRFLVGLMPGREGDIENGMEST